MTFNHTSSITRTAQITTVYLLLLDENGLIGYECGWHLMQQFQIINLPCPV